MLLQGLFHQQCIDEHEAVLSELQGKGRDLLLLPIIGGKDSLPAVTEEIIRFVPALYDIYTSLYFMTKCS